MWKYNTFMQDVQDTHDRYLASKISVRCPKTDQGPKARVRPKSSSPSQVPKYIKYARQRSRTAQGLEMPQGDSLKTSGVMSCSNSLGAKLNDGEGSVKTEILETDSAKDADERTKASGPRRLSDISMISTESKSPSVRQRSEIPKLKAIAKMYPVKTQLPVSKRIPVRTPPKEHEPRAISESARPPTPKGPTREVQPKDVEEPRSPEKEEFSSLVPRYRTELRKITEAWVNTIYCSLTMRTNLVKLLFQVHPQINRAQFQTEDEKLLKCIVNAKKYTKSEADSLVQLFKSIMVSHQKAKEQYKFIMTNKEIADSYNNDWEMISRKIAEVGEEIKQIHAELPEMQRKKASTENNQREKIRSLETTLGNKEDELKKLLNQLNVNKDKESYYKRISYLINTYLKDNINEVETEVATLQNLEKECDELKVNLIREKETTEKEIKDLERVLEEKTKILAKETNAKNQLQAFIDQTQAKHHSKHKDQFDYILRKKKGGVEKRREELWSASVKLVLRGFLIQMKKLERDRNRLLLELQSSDVDNFNNVANTILKRDNFIRTIKSQMTEFQKKVDDGSEKSIE